MQLLSNDTEGKHKDTHNTFQDSPQMDKSTSPLGV